MVDLVLSFIDFLRDNGVDLLAVWGAVITAASLIVKFTPSKKDDGIWNILVKILNALSLNPNRDKIKAEVEAELRAKSDVVSTRNLTDDLR